MTTTTENLFTATVYDFYGESLDSFTGTDPIALERQVWSVWSGSEQATTYTISDSLGVKGLSLIPDELVCEPLD